MSTNHLYTPYPEDVQFQRVVFQQSRRINLAPAIERRTAEVAGLIAEFEAAKQEEKDAMQERYAALRRDDHEAARKADNRLKRLSDKTTKLIADIRRINAFLIVAKEIVEVKNKRKASPLSFGEMLTRSAQRR